MISALCCKAALGAAASPSQDALAHGGKEPFGARRSFRPMDRYRPWLSSAERYRARYGFEREPDARRTGEQRLERPLCLHLLPSVVLANLLTSTSARSVSSVP